MANFTTAKTHGAQALPDLKAMRAAIDMGSPSINWVLIAPDGRTWVSSKPEELFAVLAPHHPLLKPVWNET